MSWRGPDGWQSYEPPVDPGVGEPGVGEPLEGESPAPVAELSPQEEEALWLRWKERGDAASRELLIEGYMPYARALAGRLYGRRWTEEIAFEEYQQLAMVGLLESIERFVPGQGAKFRTYAYSRIQGAILNGLEQVTERQQQLVTRRRILAERTASLVPEPVPVDESERLLKELGDIAVGLALGYILEGLVAGPDPDARRPADPYAQMELRETRQQVWKMVARLPEREREVVEMHYAQSRRFEEIARVLQLSRGRVAQLHRKAIVRLRGLVNKAEKCDVAY
jgi:RNA polymerase sigma factor for flagellar operon FliA